MVVLGEVGEESTLLTLNPKKLIFVEDFNTYGMTKCWEDFRKRLPTTEENNTMKGYISSASGLVKYLKWLQSKTWLTEDPDDTDTGVETGSVDQENDQSEIEASDQTGTHLIKSVSDGHYFDNFSKYFTNLNDVCRCRYIPQLPTPFHIQQRDCKFTSTRYTFAKVWLKRTLSIRYYNIYKLLQMTIHPPAPHPRSHPTTR